MRFRPLAILAGAAVIFALSAGGALAVTDNLDQHQDAHDQGNYDAADRPTAQTFTAGLSGQLDRVSLYGTAAGDSLTVRIETVDGNGHPTGTLLAPGATTTAAPLVGWFDATFTTGPSVVAGSKYAIVFGNLGFFQAAGTCTDGLYQNGEALGIVGDGSWAPLSGLGLGFCIEDFAFQTHVLGAAVAPPTISAAFSAPSMIVGQGVALKFTIGNSTGNGPVTGVGFTDTLPAGLSVSNGSVTACGGTVATTAPHGIALTGAAIADGAQCLFSVMVSGSAVGSYTTTTGAVSSTEGGTGNTATAAITADAYPTIAAVFNPSSVAAGATTQLTFTITNPAGNPDSLRFIGLTDTLPTGLTVTSAAMVTTCVGSLTVTAPNSIVLNAATAATGAPCVFSVPVNAAVAGTYTSTVAATLGGSTYPGNTATAGVGVAAPAPTATPVPTATPIPTASPTLPATNTAGRGGSDAQAPLSAPFALIVVVMAGLAGVSLTLRKKGGLR